MAAMKRDVTSKMYQRSMTLGILE